MNSDFPASILLFLSCHGCPEIYVLLVVSPGRGREKSWGGGHSDGRRRPRSGPSACACGGRSSWRGGGCRGSRYDCRSAIPSQPDNDESAGWSNDSHCSGVYNWIHPAAASGSIRLQSKQTPALSRDLHLMIRWPQGCSGFIKFMQRR